MKKIYMVTGVVMAVFALALTVSVNRASADVVPSWDLTGSYVFAFDNSAFYDVVISNQSGGSFSISGQYPHGASSYSYAWSGTGSISGNNVTISVDYTLGAIGTHMDMTGDMNADGTISGHWSDNYSGGRTGSWSTSQGAANLTGVSDWGSELSANSCANKVGAPVINITEKVTNDADSGFGGYWAMDNYMRHIQVWPVGARVGKDGSGTFCALVTYEGSATSFDAVSPGNNGQIPAGVVATMKGGYRSVPFTGTLNPSPVWQNKGNVGTVNYACDHSGYCPGVKSWADTFFTSHSSVDFDWWGWFYYAGDHGSWLNSSEGSYGNIL